MKNVTHLLAFVPIMLFVSCVQDTEPPILAVSTSSADVSRETISVGLSASAVVSSGSKNILKTIPECGFYYGDDESLSKGGKVTASMNDDGSFSASVLPEEFGKTYYYQAYLNNGLGDNKSRNISNFRTLEFEEYINLQSPQISFVPASGSATATVRLSTAEGLHLTDRGICYGETESPDDEWTTISAGSGDTDFAVTVGQLQIGKKYHARSFARLGDNIAYSDIVSFNTDAPFKGLKITPSKDWTLVPGNSLDFQVFKINNDDTETEVTSSVSWEYSTGTLSQNSVAPSRFTGTTKGSAYVKATYTESDWTESIQSDGMVTEATVIKTEYGKPQISLEVNKDIPAGGGDITKDDCNVSYFQNKTIYLSDGSKTTETVTSPATVTFSPDKISGPNLKDTVTLRRIVDSIHVTVIMNGQDSTVSAPVFQQENSVVDCTFKEPVVSVTVNKDIPASGGSVNQQDCTVSYYQIKTTTYTSGFEKRDSITTGGQITFDPTNISKPSLGTTVTPRTKVGTFTVTVSMNGKSGSASADVFQEENKIEAADIQLPKSVLILDEETDATAAITFTSGATLHQGDNGVSLSAENSIVASCSNTGHIKGLSSTTSGTNYKYYEGQSTDIVLSYLGDSIKSKIITVAPRLIKLQPDENEYHIRVGVLQPFYISIVFQNIFNGNILQQSSTISPFDVSIDWSYEEGTWINLDIIINGSYSSLFSNTAGIAYVYFYGFDWNQNVESNRYILINAQEEPR